ncbi:MAG TPA: hypothetical protein H9770_02470 [Candidatus Fournierella excrementigallinarum]|nr:hypothetical protein [Candidatus Fournierella excrementigallinarum]
MASFLMLFSLFYPYFPPLSPQEKLDILNSTRASQGSYKARRVAALFDYICQSWPLT